MPTDTYQVIAKRLAQKFDESPSRFIAFENKVIGKLLSMPEGSYMRISQVCKSCPDLMRDVASLFIMECDIHGSEERFMFLDDFDTIHRFNSFIPSVERPLPKWDPSK